MTQIPNDTGSNALSGRRRVYFISDLHLGAAYFSDQRAKERRVCDFLQSIADDARAVYLMGDVLDYWFEYRTVVPRGYVRFFGTLARLVDAGVKIVWYIGNHDIWLFDYLRDEIGIEIVDGSRVEEIMGKRFFLNHGDGVGRLTPGFRFIRSLFRNRLCQRMYSAIHPRWTIPFAHAWSSHNRQAKEGEYQFGSLDSEPLGIFARDYLRDVDPTINYFVFGHLHTMVDQPLGPHCRLVILGDWISHDSYAAFDGETLELLQYKGKEAGY